MDTKLTLVCFTILFVSVDFFFYWVFSSKVWFTGKNGICNFEGLTLFSFGYIFLLQ